MRVVRFEIDLPPKVLSPNLAQGVHWGRKGPAAREYRALAMVRCREAANGKRFGRARISFLFGLRDRRPAAVRREDARYHPSDFDNAVGSLKALIDGIVDAGVIPDDSWRHLECGEVRCDFERGPWVEVRLEEIQDG